MISVALDGPAGAGKSTIAKAVSRELGFIYVDTGALYRAIALAVLKRGYTAKSVDEITEMLKNITVDIVFKDNEQRVVLCGEDVSDKIRTPEVSMMASDTSALPVVREFLLGLQRKLAKEHNVVMDGRDIGTVVLPNAEIKIFLTASSEIRARRRYIELTEKGQDVKYEDVLEDMKTRDYNDSHRAVAPLKPADDSVTVDTSELDLAQSVAKIIEVVRERLK